MWTTERLGNEWDGASPKPGPILTQSIHFYFRFRIVSIGCEWYCHLWLLRAWLFFIDEFSLICAWIDALNSIVWGNASFLSPLELFEIHWRLSGFCRMGMWTFHNIDWLLLDNCIPVPSAFYEDPAGWWGIRVQWWSLTSAVTVLFPVVDP